MEHDIDRKQVPFIRPSPPPPPPPAAPPRPDRCATCRFYVAAGLPIVPLPRGATLAGQCHLNPPQALPVGVAGSIHGAPQEIRAVPAWAPVAPDDWCGQHVAAVTIQV